MLIIHDVLPGLLSAPRRRALRYPGLTGIVGQRRVRTGLRPPPFSHPNIATIDYSPKAFLANGIASL